MQKQKEAQGLTRKERMSISILTGWTAIHVVLLVISDGKTEFFWPFDIEPALKNDYDFSEFIVYGVIPWLIFLVYRLLSKTANNEQ